jgi:hypothetical protein
MGRARQGRMKGGARVGAMAEQGGGGGVRDVPDSEGALQSLKAMDCESWCGQLSARGHRREVDEAMRGAVSEDTEMGWAIRMERGSRRKTKGAGGWTLVNETVLATRVSTTGSCSWEPSGRGVS